MKTRETLTSVTQPTLRRQLLKSHLHVAGLAAIAFLLVAAAIQFLNGSVQAIQSMNVPTANAAMKIQLGLQRSEANLRGWVALKDPELQKNAELAWEQEIKPAFESLTRLSHSQSSEARKTQLSSLGSRLERLEKLHESTIAVAATPDNEPALLAYSQEYVPRQIELLNDVEAVRFSENHPTGEAKVAYLSLRFLVAKAEAALGLYVVDGREADASEYERRLARSRYALQYFEFLSSSEATLMPKVDALERISKKIIESRRSSLSNIAWHKISSEVSPLSAEIAEELAGIADYEVAAMRNRVGQVASLTDFMSAAVVLVLCALFVTTLYLSRSAAKRISTPFTQLFRATEELSNGNFTQRLQPNGVLEVQGLITAFNIMSESIMYSHQALEKIAYTDELTGLANRKAFNDNFNAFGKSASSEHGYVGAMVIDLDYFKQVNDSMGHDAGDHLLRVFSQRLKQSLDTEDVAARIGGDEFAVLVSSLDNENEARQLVEHLINVTSQPVIYQEQNIEPSSTIGFAGHSGPDPDICQLVKRADLALYEAKANGRGGYCFYSAQTHEKAVSTRFLVELVERNAIDDMFKLVYQPYVDLVTEEFVGAEALLRCTHPACADLSILDVITMLERSDKIESISEWVFTVAIAQLKEWRDNGWVSPEFRMSVNLSAVLLRSDRFNKAILDIVKESGVSGHLLMIEIKETTIMEDCTRSREAMRQLNEVGIEFTMDDFGTGYSSMLRLKEMPLSLLKVDRTLIRAMLTSANEVAIVDACVRLGQAIGIRVIAKGIETAEQAAALRLLGCNLGQGYHYAMPLPPDQLDFGKRLAKNAA